MKHDLTTRKYERRARKLYALFSCLVLALTVMVVPAFAADDPLIVNNLSEFIFSLIRAIGLILLGFGVLQLGLSLKSHDPSQRANGMLTIAGGIRSLLSRLIWVRVPLCEWYMMRMHYMMHSMLWRISP